MRIPGIIFLIIFSVFLCAISASAQDNPVADSLRNLLQKTEGEARLEILFSLVDIKDLSPGDRREFARDALNYASRLNEPEHMVKAYMKLGLLYYELDEFEEALESFNSCYKLSEENRLYGSMSEARINTGRVYRYLGDLDKAKENFTLSRDIAERHKVTHQQISALYYLGDLNKRIAEYDKALEIYREARELALESGDEELLPSILGDEGVISYLLGDFHSAIPKYLEAARLFNEYGDILSAGTMYLRIGNGYLEIAEYDTALVYLQQALSVFEDNDYLIGVSAVTNSMGVIYFQQELYERAIGMYFNGLEISRKINDRFEIARSLMNIGNVYNHQAADSLKSTFGESFLDSIKVETSDQYLRLFDEALKYYNESLEVWEELGDIAGMLDCVANLGIIYVNSGKPAQALDPLERALELNTQLNDRAMQANILLWLGHVYLAFDNYNTALEYLNDALELALETDTKQEILYIYRKLSEAHEKRSDYVQALNHYKLYFAMHDTLNREDRRKAIADMQVKYETEATEKENALLLAQSELADTRLKQTRMILIITIIAIGVFIVMMIQLIRQNNLKRKANRELEQKNELITEQKKEITDSIEYASRIQNAMLPPGDYIDGLMPERFIIYMPRDIVSGDYYYVNEKDGSIICVTADCTGHGVPGAFMSMLGIAFLNEIISKHIELHTDEILEELRRHVISSLHQTGKEGESQDGMDLALYILDQKKRKLEFSGANNSLLICRNGDMIEAKADKMPIGIHNRYKEPFSRHNLELKKGDMIYTFTDGYPDQFGGPKQKKFMIRNFKKMLQEIHAKPMKEQKKIMETTLQEWMADTAQIDDILVIGIRI